MRNKNVQMSLSEIYGAVSESIAEQKPALIRLLDEHLDFESLIPVSFYRAFYRGIGRSHIYHLESFIRAFVLQKILGLSQDALLIRILNCSRELREFCDFSKVPDASQFTRFREKYCNELSQMFEHLVEMTEPICREIDAKKADYLIYDTTGIELTVSENNPKFFNTKLKQAKQYAKTHPGNDPYKAVYALLPPSSQTNPNARQQYINGHFCYAIKTGIVTNGLGICRHIAFFDDEFRKTHPEIDLSAASDPDQDKELGDSTSLRPVLADFFSAHKSFSYGTFLGDSAFDSYSNYTMLKNDFGFQRACIPLNLRNSKTHSGCFNADGTPVCPVDGTPFLFLGKCGGKNRSMRFKWVCHKSEAHGSMRICTCKHPCTASQYGKCIYTYPDKNFRLYPGIPRNTEHWDNLYRHRVLVERTINLLKDTFVLDARKSCRTVSAKADIFLAGIVQLVGVLLADALHKPDCIKALRRLIAA